MSRTRHHAPLNVLIARADQHEARHLYCQHSHAGGWWVTRETVVEHPSEWHLVTEYRDSFFFGGHTWIPYEELARQYPRKFELWMALQDMVGRQRWVFGEWTETIRERVWETRECDIDIPEPRFGYQFDGEPHCSWMPKNWDLIPGTKHWNDDSSKWHRKLNYFSPERAAIRDELRDAVKDYNTNGQTDVEPNNRQARNSSHFA